MGDFRLSDRGIDADEVLAELHEAGAQDADWRHGRTWSLVYHAGDDVRDVAMRAYQAFFSENGLSPVAFPSLRRFEAEVVAMSADLLGGGPEAAGTMTSGGTESILLAVKTARDKARAESGMVNPEMVLPASAHPAFLKAAHYFDVKPVLVPLDTGFKASLDAFADAFTDRTVLAVGSAPSYPHGVIDPIPDMAAMAAARGVPFHVDACLGGFLLPWARELGRDITPFDLSVEGVTSISADIHKYGFAAKGASVIIYADRSFRRHQFFVTTDWVGGIYASPGIAGTRPGGAIAAAWAVMRYMGRSGYLGVARRILDVSDTIKDGIRSIGGLRILGEPPVSVFAFGSDELDMHHVADAMEEAGWHVDRQQPPPSIHVMVTPTHETVAAEYLEDLSRAVTAARESPPEVPSAVAAIYGMAASMPDHGMVDRMVLEFLDGLYRAD